MISKRVAKLGPLPNELPGRSRPGPEKRVICARVRWAVRQFDIAVHSSLASFQPPTRTITTTGIAIQIGMATIWTL